MEGFAKISLSLLKRRGGRRESGRIAVKVINHLGDEVMKVYSTD